jgi:uncharacterized protein involved in type VI secretion and phage assembly
MSHFLGKYRGIVTDIRDPLAIGRIRARVADVYGELNSGWAKPCAPFGGNLMGFFALPAVGANVWIEFEHGNPDYPIWSGCWWESSTEMPSILLMFPGYNKVLIQTSGGNQILLDDTSGTGGITLQSMDGQRISLTSQGIEIDNNRGATIKLTGPKVSINGDALEVT